MRRPIRSGGGAPPAALESLAVPPAELRLPLDPARHRCRLDAVVADGAEVAAGQPVARGPDQTLHAPLAGRVRCAGGEILIRCSAAAAPPSFTPPAAPDAESLPAFAAEMGLAGMGGSLFPAAVKLRAARQIHTLVVNAVECEPGLEIDMALVCHAGAVVAAGARAVAQALGARRTVLAVKRTARRHLVGGGLPGVAAEVLAMPATYPAGAEKLIVGRLCGARPPAGVLPMELGYLVFSAASLWAIGRRVLEGRPSLDRPLTLIGPDGNARNLIVPVGTAARHVLAAAGVACDPARHLLIAGGLMMGRRIPPEAPITKGVNALIVAPLPPRLLRAEEPCLLCGACYDACPLQLHPSGMAERLRAGRDSPALRAQLAECFLCGACSAVCPAEIPLARVFQEGKGWLSRQP